MVMDVFLWFTICLLILLIGLSKLALALWQVNINHVLHTKTGK